MSERGQLARWTVGFAAMVAAVVCLDQAFRIFAPPIHPLSAISDAKIPLYREMLTNGVNYDALAIGSSLIQSGFKPSEFTTATGLTAMNAGIGGNFMADRQLRVVRDIIVHKKPQFIIYGIENFALSGEPTQGPLDDPPKTQFVDWLHSHQTQKNQLDWLRSGRITLPTFTTETVISQRFSSYDNAILRSSGWLEVHAVAKPTFLPQTSDVAYSNTQIAAFRKIIDITAAAGVRLIVVQMPTFADLIAVNPSWYRRFSKFIRTETTKAGVTFLDYSSDERFPFHDIRYFYDANHLNADGSVLFTQLMASDLSGCLKDVHAACGSR
jgi:hypothetical protein